ncbi:MAG: aldo/keto reductase [Limnochordaceae bacterium]|nr:aldo/keto reductase [Limnochordaceae bacterium]
MVVQEGHVMGATGVRVPPIGQGTYRMGEGDARRDRQEIEALRLGIELGMTLIDTAEMYAGGRAEQLVGEAIRDVRDRVFLVTKVWPTNASYEGTLQAARRSLARLRVDRIDLYLQHWPSEFPVRETMRAMATLVRDGLVRFVGVSNFDARQVQEAQEALGDIPLVADQVLYHLRQRGIEAELLPYCEAHRVTVMAYAPLGRMGEFPGPDTPGGRLLAEIGRKYGKTPVQVALNWLVARPSVIAIPKAARVEHVRENAGALGWRLSEEDWKAIDEAFPAPPEPGSLPHLAPSRKR